MCKFLDFLWWPINRPPFLRTVIQSNGSSSSMDFASDILRIYRSIKSSRIGMSFLSVKPEDAREYNIKCVSFVTGNLRTFILYSHSLYTQCTLTKASVPLIIQAPIIFLQESSFYLALNALNATPSCVHPYCGKVLYSFVSVVR